MPRPFSAEPGYGGSSLRRIYACPATPISPRSSPGMLDTWAPFSWNAAMLQGPRALLA